MHGLVDAEALPVGPVEDGTALAGEDYQPRSGTILFNPGATTAARSALRAHPRGARPPLFEHALGHLLEVDLGISITIADTIGFIVGYRIDVLEVERLSAQTDQRVEGTVHGPYAGLILNF